MDILTPTEEKDSSFWCKSIGTKLEFRSKKYVVEPSILNHINLTHKKLNENGACINDALNEIKQYENISSSYNCEYFNNDETKSLLNDGTKERILNIALKRISIILINIYPNELLFLKFGKDKIQKIFTK